MRADYISAMAHINNMGGIKSRSCDLIAKEIWSWCIQKNIWISAEYLPGSENVLADRESRIFNDSTKWMLNKSVFLELTKSFVIPDIDLFASRLNKLVDKFVSWKPDPHAVFIDAFSRSWED